MLKKYITYTDYNGKQRREAFYFNLSKAELIKMEITADGGMEALLQRIVDTHDNRMLFDLFEKMIQLSYGVKSEDGKRFIKNQQVLDEFVQSEAYTELLLELMGENATDKVLEFVKGIMPLDGVSEDEINAAVAKAATTIDAADAFKTGE